MVRIITSLFIILLVSLGLLKYGAIDYAWSDLLNVFIGHANLITNIDIWHVRFPMIIFLGFAGACLSVSGLLLQKITHNALACPSILGVEYAVALTVIILQMFLPSMAFPLLMMISFLVAMFTFMFNYIISYRLKLGIAAFTLMGVAINAFFYAIIQAVMLAYPDQAQTIIYNLNGSSLSISLKDLYIVLPLCFLMGITWCLRHYLDYFSLDDESLVSIGFSTKRFQLIFITISIAMTTLVTTVIGPLILFGLIVPNIVRILYPTKKHLLLCILYGVILILFIQLIINLFSAQTPLPLGDVVLLFASPLLVYVSRTINMRSALCC